MRKQTSLHKTSVKKQARRWSSHVTKKSNALDLKPNVFTKDDPKKIAKSLKASAEKSTKKKSEPFRSAMSMITFYMNRAGKNLSATQKNKLTKAKNELRQLFGRNPK